MLSRSSIAPPANKSLFRAANWRNGFCGSSYWLLAFGFWLLAFDVLCVPPCPLWLKPFSYHRGHMGNTGEHRVNLFLLEAMMRGNLLLLGTVLAGVTMAFSQAPSSKPVSAFDQQLIDQQKQFLQAAQNKNLSIVESAVADD